MIPVASIVRSVFLPSECGGVQTHEKTSEQLPGRCAWGCPRLSGDHHGASAASQRELPGGTGIYEDRHLLPFQRSVSCMQFPGQLQFAPDSLRFYSRPDTIQNPTSIDGRVTGCGRLSLQRRHPPSRSSTHSPFLVSSYAESVQPAGPFTCAGILKGDRLDEVFLGL